MNIVDPFRSNLVGPITMKCGKCYNKGKHKEEGVTSLNCGGVSAGMEMIGYIGIGLEVWERDFLGNGA